MLTNAAINIGKKKEIAILGSKLLFFPFAEFIAVYGRVVWV
ncbi:putative membrane protein [Wolbachia pipientis wVitA]|nr:putative membrane protein [Wolbachia pipientis wVitA]